MSIYAAGLATFTSALLVFGYVQVAMRDGLTVGELFSEPPPWLEGAAAMSLIVMPIFVGYDGGWQAGLSIIPLGAVSAVAVTRILRAWAQLFALVALSVGWLALVAYLAV